MTDRRIKSGASARALVVGETFRAAEGFEPAAAEYRRALEQEEELNIKERVQARIGLADCLHASGDYEASRAALTPLLDLELERRDRAAAIARLGWASFFEGDGDACIEHCSKAVDLLMPTQHHSDLANYLRWLGHAFRWKGELRKAESRLRDALAAARRGGDLGQLACCLNAQGIVCRSLGRYEESVEHHLESLDLNEKRGSRKHAAVAQLEIALAHLYSGNWSEAATSLEHAERAFAELAYPRGIVDGQIVRSRLLRRRGRPADARESAHQALEAAEEISYKRGSVLALEEIGDIAYESEQWTEARRTFSQALKAATTVEPEGDLVYELSWRMARLELRRGETDRADELAWRSIRLAEQSADQRELGHALLTLAMVRAAQNDDVETTALVHRALASFRNVHTPYELAGAHEIAAQLSRRFSNRPAQEAVAHLTEAVALYERLGSDHERQRARSSLRNLSRTTTPSGSSTADTQIITQDPILQRVLRMATELGPVDATVLIEGETGTGKELVARLIHDAGDRRGHRLVPVNCASIAKPLLASELFGHKKGAFTGAETDREGLLVSAAGGTVLLDEIDKASTAFQASLLRVLEDGEVRPVGGTVSIPHHARILCASNRDLQELAEKGEFLPDLYYRLSRFRLQIPPLRERREDIPLLTVRFLEDCVGTLIDTPVEIATAALSRLVTYSWPGNVRELQNVIACCAFFAREGGVIEVAHLPQNISMPAGVSGESLSDEIAQLERGRILKALRKAKGVKTDAARELGISRKGLRDRMRRLGLSEDGRDYL